jgi:hypothetical protein
VHPNPLFQQAYAFTGTDDAVTDGEAEAGSNSERLGGEERL